MQAWPVPLRSITSWVQFVDQMAMAERLEFSYEDDVVELATSLSIDDFTRVIQYVQKKPGEGKALAAAALKDAAQDLIAHGLYVLSGRYVSRSQSDPDIFGLIDYHFTMLVRIRSRADDLAHTVDRSEEPLQLSWAEEDSAHDEDEDFLIRLLEWEEKRPSLWLRTSSHCNCMAAGGQAC